MLPRLRRGADHQVDDEVGVGRDELGCERIDTGKALTLRGHDEHRRGGSGQQVVEVNGCDRRERAARYADARFGLLYQERQEPRPRSKVGRA